MKWVFLCEWRSRLLSAPRRQLQRDPPRAAFLRAAADTGIAKRHRARQRRPAADNNRCTHSQHHAMRSI
jgi:hypothetical protein